MKKKHPKVFISYSWDNKLHKDWVLELATRLRRDGIETMIDQWGVVPGRQLPEFMERSVRENDFVLIICTPKYKEKSDKRLGGVGYEGDIMTAEALTFGKSEKFIPIIRQGEWAKAAASWLLGKAYVDLSGEPYDDDEYLKLLDALLGRRIMPPIGPSSKSTKGPIFSREHHLALQKYLQYLIDSNTYIDPRGIMQTRRSVALKLEEVYVSLATLPETFMLDINEFREKMISDKKANLDELVFNGDIYDELAKDLHIQTKIIGPAEVVRENARLVILGDPGAGKTTLLRFLALQFAKSAKASPGFSSKTLVKRTRVKDKFGFDYGPPRFPILIRISGYADAFAQNRVLSLREFILINLAGEVNLSTDILRPVLESILDAGQALILLDGLDEIVNDDNRNEIGRRIEQFVAGHIGNHFIVTSRIAGYKESLLSGDFAHFTLQNMERIQIEKFIRCWCPAVERLQTPNGSEIDIHRRAEKEINGILESIDENPGVQRLASNPLMLTILALIHRAGTRLPSRRVELYELAAKTLLEDWELARGISKQHIVTEGEALRLLGPLAYWLHDSKQRGVASEREVKTKLAETLATSRGLSVEHPDVDVAVDDFLRRVRQHTGLFVERAPKQYGFMHMTFEEYFAARELVRRRNETAMHINAHRGKPRWQEPVLLAISFISSDSPEDAADLIRTSILGEGPGAEVNGFRPSVYEDILHRDLLLAVQAISDCIGLDATFTFGLAQRLLAIYFDIKGAGKYEPLQESIVKSLRLLKFADNSKLLVNLASSALEDKDKDIKQRASIALSTLGQGDSNVTDNLLVALGDKDSDVRRRTVTVLGALDEGTPIVLTSLQNALDDKSRGVRICAADALGTLDVEIPKLVAGLIFKLANGDKHAQKNAAEALGILGAKSEDAVNGLLKTLKGKDEYARRQAAGALGLLPVGTVHIAEALTMALIDADGVVRQRAADTLGALKLGFPEVITGLIGILNDEYPGVRSSAVEALGSIDDGSPDVITSLLEKLSDNDADVRSSTARALGLLGVGTPETITGLLKTLNDEHYYVRMKSAIALGRLGVGTPDVLGALLIKLEDKNEMVRSSVADALGAIGKMNSEVMDGLLSALKDEREVVRASVAEAFGALKASPNVTNELFAALNDAHGYVSVTAAAVLVNSGRLDANIINKLIAAMSNDLPGVRAVAARTLGRLRGLHDSDTNGELLRKAKESLYKALNNKDIDEMVYMGRYYWRVYSFIWQALWDLTTPL